MYSKTISALILYLFFFCGGGGDGRLFEAGRLLTFPTYRVGAYSRWALIRGWALNQINTVSEIVLGSSFRDNSLGTFRDKG